MRPPKGWTTLQAPSTKMDPGRLAMKNKAKAPSAPEGAAAHSRS